MAFTVKRYNRLVHCELGANIEAPESNFKTERDRIVYLGGLVIITRTAGDAALLLPLARIGSPVVFEFIMPNIFIRLLGSLYHMIEE